MKTLLVMTACWMLLCSWAGLGYGEDIAWAAAASLGATASPDDIHWQYPFCPIGLDSTVQALTVYDGKLIVGGYFTAAPCANTNYIACWDGTSWTSLDSGMNGPVYALTVYEGKLIAGGYFTVAGSVWANSIAAWDGTSWAPLGSGMIGSEPEILGSVNSLTVYEGKLIAGGYFSTAGGVVAHCVAAWDGTGWSPLGSGTNSGVLALTVYDNKLIAGGGFSSAGDIAPPNYIYRIASWDGENWAALGLGFNSLSWVVNALAVYDGKLIAAGAFGLYGRTCGNCDNIASWDGTNWEVLGGGSGNTFLALTVHNDLLILGEYCGGSYRAIRSWDGSSWGTVGTGMLGPGGVFALTTYNGELIAGGLFPEAGEIEANNLASWDGAKWFAFGTEIVGGPVLGLSSYDGELIAAGGFKQAGGLPANGIASWNGTTWDSLGSGIANPDLMDRLLIVYQDRLIVGGAFSTAGGVPVNNIASWDGVSWDSLGSGLNGSVIAMTLYDNKLVAAGHFGKAGGVPANMIAAWDGAGWAPLGSGPSCDVRTMAAYGNKLFVGGLGYGTPENCLQVWDGASWTAPAAGLNSTVSALAVFDDKLIVGGGFTMIGGVSANHIASWDGASWAALGLGTDPWGVGEFTVYDNTLIASGSFTTAGGDSANNIASWDGTTWAPLGSGTDYGPGTMVSYDNSLWVASVNVAGGKTVHYLAQWIKRYPTGIETPAVPGEILLEQNVPNPFNPTTLIHFALKERADVSLRIYDVTGRLVRVVVDESRPAGRYAEVWDGRNSQGRAVASGVYFCRLDAGTLTQTRKMILLR